MAKVKITVQEVIKYHGEIIIEQPDDMSDDELSEILGEVEKENQDGTVGDIAYDLQKKFGVNVIYCQSNFPDSHHDSELEIYDVSNVKNDEGVREDGK